MTTSYCSVADSSLPSTTPAVVRTAQTGSSGRLVRAKLERVLPHHHGFTLLELLVVVAIIGLLAAYVGPKYFSQIGRSEQAVAKSQIESFRGALGAYRIDTGAYPSSEEGLAALLARPSDSARATKWNGPYLEKALPADPWGRPYLYRSPLTKDDYELNSYGKDGQPGGTGDDADLTSR